MLSKRFLVEEISDCNKIIDDLIVNDVKDILSEKTIAHKLILLFKFISMSSNQFEGYEIDKINTYALLAIVDWSDIPEFTRLLTLVV